ncbi:hypothetical protein ACX0G9_02775 [Flavitalea flava]
MTKALEQELFQYFLQLDEAVNKSLTICRHNSFRSFLRFLLSLPLVIHVFNSLISTINAFF